MDWEAPLARDLELKNASVQRKLVLRSLSDAANLLTSIAAGRRDNDAGGLLFVLINEAARSGRQEDVAAATDVLERYLASRFLI
jgi:hypothetical protein